MYQDVALPTNARFLTGDMFYENHEEARLRAQDCFCDAGFDNFVVAVAPEPGTALLLASGLAAMALGSRR